MRFTTEVITPEKARLYLDTQVNNRPPSQVYVNRYAEAMKKGDWLLNGICIVFDSKGNLVDGQHRLLAVIKADVSVTMTVCYGADAESFKTFDCGRHRTKAQLLAMLGIGNYTATSSIVNGYRIIATTGRLYANNGMSSRLDSNLTFVELFQQDADGFEKAALLARKWAKTNLISAQWMGSIYYYLTHDGGFDEDYVKGFFEALNNLEDVRRHPIVLLRKLLINAKLKNAKIKESHLWAYIAKTWNDYVNDRYRKCLKFNEETEEIPQLEINRQLINL